MSIGPVQPVTSSGKLRHTLIPLDGGSPVEIVKDITVIGRKEFCDVRLEDPSVSKTHLVVTKVDGVLMFRDLGSTNGTKVNGQRVIRGALLPNDKLNIAAVKYQLQVESIATEAEVNPPIEPQAQNTGDDPVVKVYKAPAPSDKPVED